MYDLPNCRNDRTCSLGFGQKTNTYNKSIIKNPSPFEYNITSEFNDSKRGHKFGISRYVKIFNYDSIGLQILIYVQSS